uniref:CSON009152 protein n=1 Tax=Culicoides sonorensis TaxID=179676 RepID=A0A336LPN4_CULSO
MTSTNDEPIILSEDEFEDVENDVLPIKITEVKTLASSRTIQPLRGRPSQIRYKRLPTGQRIKIVPPRVSIPQGTSKEVKSQPTIELSKTPSTSSSSSQGSSSSRKRKSQHVTKPLEDTDVSFKEAVVIENTTENTDLMEYVAYLRVALNRLLMDVNLEKLDLPAAVGKVKISDRVKDLINAKVE